MSITRTLSWAAGKSGGAPTGVGRWVAELLSGRGRNIYCEPYCGMLGVLLQRHPAAAEILSDTDGRVLAWWRAVRDEPEALAARLRVTPMASREHLEEAKRIVADAEAPDVHRAAALAVCCESTWHDTTYRWAAKNLNWLDWPNVLAMADRLRGVTLWHSPADETLTRLARRSLATTPSALVYCDPPYPGTTNPYAGTFTTADADAMCDGVELLVASGWDVAVSASPGAFPRLEACLVANARDVAAMMGPNGRRRTELLLTSWQPDPTLFP